MASQSSRRPDRARGLIDRALAALRLTPGGGFALVMIVVGWVGARVVGSRTAYLMVYAALLALIMAWVAGRRRVDLSIDRSGIPTRMRAGQVEPVEFRATANRRISTVLLREELAVGMGDRVTIPIGSLARGAVIEHSYSLRPVRRGVYEIGPTIAEWSDPFGFTTHSQVLSDAVEVVVQPDIESVSDHVLTRMWEDPPVRPPVSKPWPVGFEFYGMRDYEPGDDLRRVVWSVVARTGRMMVRESEQGITDRVVIHVDSNRATHSPGDVSETFEVAVRAAASIGARHIDDGFAVTLTTNRGIIGHALRGAAARLTFLDLLARLELDDLPFESAARVLSDEAATRPHVLVLTAGLDQTETKHLKPLIDQGVSTVVAHVQETEGDLATVSAAAAIGCQVVQIPPGAALSAVFASNARAGAGR